MTPGTTTFSRLFALLALLAGGLCWGAVPAAAQDPNAPEAEETVRYATIATAGAHVRNLPDADGVSIARPAAGTLVTIHRERAGWYEVEVPGGFAVWIFGRYVRPVEGQDGVYEVTRNAVNIRPAPKSDILSFPLPQRLHAGDRVRGIELLDPQADLATTWLRIWSPPGVHAWMRATDTAPLAEGQDGKVLWAETMATLGERVAPQYVRPVVAGADRGSAAGTTPAGQDANRTKAEQEARTALEEVRRDLETEIEKATPDLGAIRTRLDDLVANAPTGEISALVRHEISRLALYEEVARVQAELQREKDRRAEEARRRQVEAWEASLAKDPLGHVFHSRGVLLREVDASGASRYRLRFGKEIVSEVVCASGRYDLDAFAGFEVGVRGEVLRTTGDAFALSVIDVSRLEVTARR